MSEQDEAHEPGQSEIKSEAKSARTSDGKLKTTIEMELPGWDAASKSDKKDEPAPIVTQHSIEVNGVHLAYSVTTGRLALRDENGEVEAHIFFMAYIRLDAGDLSDRPLIFSFNGGPGSASVWLHLGAVGPKRVQMKSDGQMPPPPFRLEDNPLTWLEHADLVFIDPVGTGYSRPVKPELGKKFWGVKGDISSVGQFITNYLTIYTRWTSPLFLVGESYGTTRAAGLAGHLIERGVAFNGILLVSSILHFQTARFATGNDLPYVLFLPTYTATAWYHGRLAKDLQKDLHAALSEAEAWALGEYSAALAAGDALSRTKRDAIVRKLSRFTGIGEQYVSDSDLRIPIFRFCKELLRSDRKTVGRLDSRFKGIDASGVSETPDFDPSMAAITPPYTSTFNHYVRTQLGYVTDLEYHILGSGIKTPWEWDADNVYVETGESLRSAMSHNPHMQLFVASGYFDLATPYFATQYTLAHLGLDSSLRANITTAEYKAGHMMYIDTAELAKLKTDVGQFIEKTMRSHALL